MFVKDHYQCNSPLVFQNTPKTKWSRHHIPFFRNRINSFTVWSKLTPWYTTGLKLWYSNERMRRTVMVTSSESMWRNSCGKRHENSLNNIKPQSAMSLAFPPSPLWHPAHLSHTVQLVTESHTQARMSQGYSHLSTMIPDISVTATDILTGRGEAHPRHRHVWLCI